MLTGNYINNETLNWVGGSIAGDSVLTNNGTLNLTGIMYGTSPWTTSTLANAGTLTLVDDSSIENAFIAGGPTGYSDLRLTNTGTIRKATGDGTADINVLADNTGGLVEVQSGQINFNAGGVLAGTYQTSGSGVVAFNGGTFTVGTFAITGDGVAFNGGTLAPSGTVNLTGLHLRNGTVTGTFATAGTTSWEGSTLTGNYTNNETLNWVSGAISGGATLTNAGTLNLSGTMTATLGSSALSNTGTLNLADGSTIANASPYYSGDLSLTNTGTIRKATGDGTASILLASAVLNSSSGGVSVDRGTLAFSSGLNNAGLLSGGGAFSGLVVNESGGHIAPGNNAGTLTFESGLTLRDGSVLDFQLGADSDRIAVTGGTLTGSGSVGGITLNLTALPGFGAGTFSLISGSTFADFDATDFAMGAAPAGFDYRFCFSDSVLTVNVAASAVPEPSACAALLGLTAAGFAAYRRRQKRRCDLR